MSSPRPPIRATGSVVMIAFYPARPLPRTSTRWLCLALAALAGQASADALRVPMSDAEIRAFGEDPASGEFYRLPHDPSLDDADAHVKAITATRYTSIAGTEFRPRSDAASFNAHNHATL